MLATEAQIIRQANNAAGGRIGKKCGPMIARPVTCQ
jgi:hypothetical protein